VNEKRAFTPHPKFDFGLHLPSDAFVFTLGHAGCGNGVGDFVTKPRHHPCLAGSVARHVSADHPREFNDLTVIQIIAEGELRTRSFHEFWDLLRLNSVRRAVAANHICGTVMPRCPWYFPARSA
jgi:hypothetical protein